MSKDQCIMSMSNIDETPIKQIIFDITEVISSVSTNTDEFDNALTQSNEIMAKTLKSIDSANSAKPRLQAVELILIDQKLPEIKQSLSKLRTDFKQSITEMLSVKTTLEAAIQTLAKSTESLNESDQLRVDVAGIVTVNKLKIKILEQKVQLAKKQVASIDRFVSITITHFKDTVDRIKHEGELDSFQFVFALLSKVKSKYKCSKYSAVSLLALCIYNYLASAYMINLTIDSMVYVPLFILVAALLCFSLSFTLYTFFDYKVNEFGFLDALWLVLIVIFFLTLIPAIVADNTSTVHIVIDFFSLGWIGGLAFLVGSMVSAILAYRWHNQAKYLSETIKRIACA